MLSTGRLYKNWTCVCTMSRYCSPIKLRVCWWRIADPSRWFRHAMTVCYQLYQSPKICNWLLFLLYAINQGESLWYPRWDSNPQNLVSKTSTYAIPSPGHVVVVVGIDPTSSPYEGGTHPSTSHNRKIGVSYRYRSGTTAFTEQCAGHYTKDTIELL